MSILYQYRFIAVIAFLGLAAFLATERGKLPLALRGLRKMMRRDAGLAAKEPEREKKSGVPQWKRLLAFVLVIVAFVIAVM